MLVIAPVRPCIRSEHLLSRPGGAINTVCQVWVAASAPHQIEGRLVRVLSLLFFSMGIYWLHQRLPVIFFVPHILAELLRQTRSFLTVVAAFSRGISYH